MMKKQILLTLILGILLSLISLTSASVFCDKSLIESYSPLGLIPSSETFICSTTNSNETNVNILASPSFFSLSSNTITDAESPKTFTINFDLLQESREGYITFDNSDAIIQVKAIMNDSEEPEPTEGCRLIELPHTTTYRIKQGETGASSQIRIKVSNDCPTLTMSVIEETQMTKPMYLQGQSGDIGPGEEFTFSIGLDAVDVATGGYNNRYTVSGYSSDDDINYQKSIFLSTLVTFSTSPTDSESFTSLPQCSLDSDMYINVSHSLVCNNDNPNIGIEVLYNEYFEGTGLTESDGRIEYKITPKKVGNTVFIASFNYKGFNIGEPFIKDVRIMQGNMPVSGTELEILFYQGGEKKTLEELGFEETNILVRDFNTKNVVPSYTAYLNGQVVNNTITFEPDKNYDLIIQSPGYMTKNLNFTVNPKSIEIIINPTSGDLSTYFNISTSIANATLIINQISYPNPYHGLLFSGLNTIQASKDGYNTKIINLTLEDNIRIIQSSLFEKGKEHNITLNKEVAEWVVQFQKDLEVETIPEDYVKGTGSFINFNPKKGGFYTIVADGVFVTRYEIERFSWKNSQGKFRWFFWVLVIGGPILIIIVIILIFKFKGGGGSTPGFRSAPIVYE